MSPFPVHSELGRLGVGLISMGAVVILAGSSLVIILTIRFRRETPPPAPQENDVRRDQLPVDCDGYLERRKENVLSLQETVGKGEFGVVSRALLTLAGGGSPMEVAVKSLHSKATAEDLACFTGEVEVLKKVGQHKNLVSLVGFSTSQHLILVEYCPLGDLLAFLRQARKMKILLGEVLNAEYNRNDVTGKDGQRRTETNLLYGKTEIERKQIELTTLDLLGFAQQIATGMKYLSDKTIIHRDLAARNVLLTSDLTAKIADFGLSRGGSVYKKKNISKLPVKWMAPESLSYQIFTTHSDVWSFGILLWEMMTLGGTPYPTVPTASVASFLQKGFRLECPPSTTIPVYEVMKACWAAVPRERPSFSTLLHMLGTLAEDKGILSHDHLDKNCMEYAHLNQTEVY